MKWILAAALLALVVTAHGQTSGEQLLDEGYALYMDQEYEKAIESFDQALVLDSLNAETYYLRGVCRSSLGQKREAMSDLNAATRLDAEYAEAYYEKGYLFLTDKNAEWAIREFNRVIELKPGFAEAYVSRGTARCMMDDKEGANADWEKAVDLGVTYTAYMSCD